MHDLLGVDRKRIVTGSINDYKTEGKFYWVNGQPSGRPSQTDNCAMDVKRFDSFICQVVYGYYPRQIIYRWYYNDTWEGWTKVTTSTYNPT